MGRLSGIAFQAIAYAAFAATLAYFSRLPAYDYAPSTLAVVKVSLSHATDRVEPCVQLTPQQIAELPPNMRRQVVCERARLPLILELDVDGAPMLRIEARPSGLWDDGPASVYERLQLEPGAHRLALRLRDSHRSEGWDYELEEQVSLEAGRYFTVTFRADNGGFRFR